MGRNDVRHLRWAWVSLAGALLGGLALLAFLLRAPSPGAAPASRGGTLRWAAPLAASGGVLLGSLWYVFTFVDRQQQRIERQRRELETLHALDTAILRELDEPRLLEVVVLRVLTALDAEAAGVVLLTPDRPEPHTSAFRMPGRDAGERARFEAVVHSGGRPDRDWEAVVLPLGEAGGPTGFLGAGRFRPCRPFSAAEFGLLAALSDTVVVAVANARALQAARETARVREDLERERRVARVLTESLLPQIPARIGGWGFSHCYDAQSDEAPVGGDIYDLFALDGGRLAVVIADVSGKGLAAAQKTAMVKYTLRSYAREHASPARVVQRLNAALFDEPEMTGFVTLVYGVLDGAGGFTFASAGHEPPLIRRASGVFESLPSTGTVLGVVRHEPYTEEFVTLAPGDGMLLFTDGLSEARAPNSKVLLGPEGVIEMLNGLRDVAPEAMAGAVRDAARRFSTDRLNDDTALLWIERVAGGDSPDGAK